MPWQNSLKTEWYRYCEYKSKCKCDEQNRRSWQTDTEFKPLNELKSVKIRIV